MLYTLEKVAGIVDGKIIGEGSEQIITQVYIDSRVFDGAVSGLFFGIPGPNHNGKTFIPDLYTKGARLFVTEQIDYDDMPDAVFIEVENGLEALHKLAAFHRRAFQGKVIGITGSNGKTIVKEWLFHLLKDDFNICRSPKSYNSKVGVPLSLFLLNERHDIAIIEAGISMPGEMAVLEEMIKPDYGVLTNIGQAHLENFDSQESLSNEKHLLFNSTKWVVSMLEKDSEIALTFVEEQESGSMLLFREKEHEHKVFFPFNDVASIQNIECAIRTARRLGLNWERIIQNACTLPRIAMRLEMRNGINGCKIINDSYNSDIIGLQIALDYLRRFSGRKTLILSSLQLDSANAHDVYDQVVSMINRAELDRIILVGDEILTFADAFKAPEIISHVSTDDLIRDLSNIDFDKDVILVKGSREFGFERVSMQLEDKPHSTFMEVNLNHLADNLHFYKSRLLNETKIMAMVKALSYGTGTDEVANMLEFNRVDYFGVAYASEGVSLREAGTDLPIMVMNVDEGSFDSLIKHRLEPVVYSHNQLDAFIRRLIAENMTGYPVHIELDTGMHRLGFQKDDLNKLLSTLQTQPEVRVVSIFSHLSAADDPDMEIFSNIQISRFNEWSGLMLETLQYPILRHLCNTAGIMSFPEAHYDMVRLGVGLYGVDPLGKNDLKPVASLFSTISQTKVIPKNDPIGYGCSEIAKEDMRIGILPIGYADGLSRSLSNGKGYVVHQASGEKLPIVGRVCMDMTMVDLKQVHAQEGDRIEIFGKQTPIKTFAGLLDTIPYEVLTSVSTRVTRVFVSE